MDVINVIPHNSIHYRIQCEPGIAQELADHFTFMSPNAKFSPLFKRGMWDGKIRLFSAFSGVLYVGLLPRLLAFAKARDYEVAYEPPGDYEISLREAEDFFTSLKLPVTPHDYQVEAFLHAVRKNRSITKSPTASGKSLIIYALTEWYRQHGENILVVVPTLQLVHQMKSDFVDYGIDPNLVHTMYAGQEKNTNRPVVITTWQSIYQLKEPWFARFGTIIGDEAHLWKAKSLVSIMTKCNATHRFALTGTLDGAVVHLYVLEGLFGNVYETAKTKDLIEQKKLASLQIKSIQLMYSPDNKFQLVKKTWQECIDWLVNHTPRNRFIRNLALSLKGNTLLLFQYVDKHGKPLYDMIKKANEAAVTQKSVFFVHGGVEGEEREEIRKLVEKETDAIIIASFGTFSTGSNIVNLHNVIFASPFKSKIKGLQSIGRSLRRGENKESATLFDIGDDVANVFVDQLAERINVYSSEGFPIKYYNVKLKG